MKAAFGLLFLASCAVSRAHVAVEATTVDSHDAGRNLQLDLDALKAKAAEHADAIRKNAPGALAGAQDAAGKAWGFTSTVSQKAAEQASTALEQSMNKSMDMLFAFLKLSDGAVPSNHSLTRKKNSCSVAHIFTRMD